MTGLPQPFLAVFTNGSGAKRPRPARAATPPPAAAWERSDHAPGASDGAALAEAGRSVGAAREARRHSPG